MATIDFKIDQASLEVVKNAKIICNFEEVEKGLAEAMAVYKNVIVTPETINAAKNDIAKLRKVSAAIDAERKRVKKECMRPYEEVEPHFKKLKALCDEGTDGMSNQVKGFEDELKTAKINRLREFYDNHKKANPEYMNFEDVFNKKWTNFTFAEKDAQREITDYIEKIDVEIGYIKCMDTDFESELLLYYKSGHSMTECLAHLKTLEEMKETRERQERERAERERIRREAEEKAKADLLREKEKAEITTAYEPMPNVEDEESELINIRRTILPLEGQSTQNENEAETHIVKLWVRGTAEQLATLRMMFLDAGVEYGAL